MDRLADNTGSRPALLLLIALLGGCTSFPRLEVRPVAPAQRIAAPKPDEAGIGAPPTTGIKLLSPDARAAAGEGRGKPVVEVTPEQIAALLPERPIAATLPPQPLTQFIDTVFGDLLGLPYFTGPDVARRRDLVALSGPIAMSNRRFFAMVQAALRQYGLAVAIENGVVQIVEDELLSSRAPLFMRARALPETPPASRPVIRFASLSSVSVGAVTDVLQTVYRDRGAIRFLAQEGDNALVISGNPREVESAIALVETFDQPGFAGGQVARIEPVFWTAEALAETVRSVLATEGFAIGPEAGVRFLPVPFANSILIFASDRELFRRALYWIRELDSPGAFADQDGVFIYTVENTTAAELGALVAQLTPGGRAPEETPKTIPITGERSALPRPDMNADAAAARAPVTNGRITIDPGGNRLLFRGKRSEFATLRALMAQLDTPPKQVLVQVTVAEVTLSDDTRFGIEWLLDAALFGGDVTADTRGGLAREPGGLGATFTRVFSTGTVQAALNAIAQNRNLNILSTPRLVARSGSEAQILIGSDVPIITSQRAAGNQTNGDTDILQTVQYRQTGVILNMRPVIYGADRVDIELYQEVSSQEPNRTSPIASPLILNRSVTTQLSLREGMTAVIGGLIQDNYSREQKGVPLLKDIPLIGQAFRVDAMTGAKVELLLLVTPYILRSDENMGEASAAYAGSINRLLKERGPQVYTLLPWRSPFDADVRRHGGAPAEQEDSGSRRR
ncbi:secretin N-terminal domain-containing protein [Sphingomonas oleivorans]|nr:secretin N-terminal domain-containing protein [Sphingomonas oleivorans]